MSNTGVISCAGTLINQRTVLTSASCIADDTVTIDGVEYLVRANSYYPTFESMFTVYMGAWDASVIRNNEELDANTKVGYASAVYKVIPNPIM